MASERRDRRSYLEDIIEAPEHLPERVRALAPDVPWSRIAGMRDRIAPLQAEAARLRDTIPPPGEID